jgi:hypothetical protein
VSVARCRRPGAPQRIGDRWPIPDRHSEELFVGVRVEGFRESVSVPFRTQHPLGAVVNRPSVCSDR